MGSLERSMRRRREGPTRRPRGADAQRFERAPQAPAAMAGNVVAAALAAMRRMIRPRPRS